jgi:hypothetical protein
MLPKMRAKAQVPSRTKTKRIDVVAREMVCKNLIKVKTKRNVSKANEDSLSDLSRVRCPSYHEHHTYQ